MILRRLAPGAYMCTELRGAWASGEVRDVPASVAARLLEQHPVAFERVGTAPPVVSALPPAAESIEDYPSLGARLTAAFLDAGLSPDDVRGMTDDELCALRGVGMGSVRRARKVLG